ncbi:cell wall hydrolase [Phenylobacterium deserti]|uniref:cell wall hydrolase n=1 Tax=Phenylobacterium deserti TaxID=1914756 RepID=UPI001F0BAD65|nr:cell wall hydrolase [Phenylobacterium deserti]
MLHRFRSLVRHPLPATQVAGLQLGLLSVLCLAISLAALPSQTNSARLTQAPVSAPRAMVLTPAATSGEDQASQDDLIRLQDLSPDAARLWNASNPISDLPNPPARPFRLEAEGVLDEARATDCLTAAIYYEAAFESVDGQRAVAQVVLNRMRHPAFPKTVCGVVFQGSERTTGCQFTFTCDGSLARKPAEEGWMRARKIAEAALHGYVMKKVGNATHYHAEYVAPYWSPSLVKVRVIGAHIFYRWTGGAGLPPAFGGRYAGGEAKGMQLAVLDDLAKNQGKLNLTPVSETAAIDPAAVEPVAAPVAEAAPAVAADAVELVTPAKAAPAPEALTKSEELDWAGRPKAKGPPRLAMPSGGMSF